MAGVLFGLESGMVRGPYAGRQLGQALIVYAHVRLRLQRQAIDTLGDALSAEDDDRDDPPAAAVVR
ncbi:hypothetical protein ACIGJO_16285 [Streptomyces sp. NPDC079020]|uniref:hypothetical protein n=1 Tax=Streptomyces sp. NPDC079020 TaxID=3365722 RepID=UPI0037D8286C